MLKHVSPLLVEAREARSLGLGDVEYETKIPRFVLAFLEGQSSSNHHQLDESRVLGFLKTYIDFLHLDRNKVLELYHRVEVDTVIAPYRVLLSYKVKEPVNKKGIILLVGVGVVFLLLLGSLFAWLGRKAPTPLTDIILPELTPLGDSLFETQEPPIPPWEQAQFSYLSGRQEGCVSPTRVVLEESPQSYEVCYQGKLLPLRVEQVEAEQLHIVLLEIPRTLLLRRPVYFWEPGDVVLRASLVYEAIEGEKYLQVQSFGEPAPSQHPPWKAWVEEQQAPEYQSYGVSAQSSQVSALLRIKEEVFLVYKKDEQMGVESAFPGNQVLDMGFQQELYLFIANLAAVELVIQGRPYHFPEGKIAGAYSVAWVPSGDQFLLRLQSL